MSDATSTETPAPAEIHPEQPVSVEMWDGRVFTGVGETEDVLREGLPTPSDKRESRGQKRFNDLTRKREDANRAREAAEQRAADLEARLKALEEKPAPKPVATVAPAAHAPVQPAAAAAPEKPKLQAFVDQIGTKYQTWEDAHEAYIDAREEHLQAQLDARVRSSIEADRASRTFLDQVNTARVAAQKVHADFDAVLQSVDDVFFPRETLALIATLPDSGLVQYQLAKNRPLAEKIASMRDPGLIGFELAKLMAGSAVASSASTAVPVASLPPAPMQPVGSGSKTTVLSPSQVAERGDEDYDSSGFREAQRASRRR